jgi:hypothetical protein
MYDRAVHIAERIIVKQITECIYLKLLAHDFALGRSYAFEVFYRSIEK